jgi:fatty-acyl-CoA synthase
MGFAVGDVHDAIATTRPDQECLVFRDRRYTWAQVAERTRRLANVLHHAGLGCHAERDRLEPWQSGQDHLAVYLHNGNEYLEAMLGAFKARVAPFNVNYRYVADELRYLLNDARATGIVFGSSFAATLAAVRDDVPTLRLLLQVDDGGPRSLLPGAVWYEDALAAASPTPPPVTASPDDLYILYTGGTTGMPKGVLWRQGDALVECFGGSRTATTLADFVEAASASPRRAVLAPPFMHGAGHWMSFSTWHTGGTVFVQDHPEKLIASDIWGLVERERIDFLLIVGDAFARPLLDELDQHRYDLSSLTVLLSGGAPLSADMKRSLLRHLPALMIIDGLGSSEAGGQVSQLSVDGTATSGSFTPTESTAVLAADLSRELTPDEPELGWLAKRGRMALGYLGDPDKTARTYPVVGGVRYAVPGDRACYLPDGTVEVRGRDSVTINSGGEKIFAEEVEAALKAHPDVYDCVVTGRPSERWGNEVVAIVQLRLGRSATAADLLALAAERIARYKLPKDVVFVEQVVRSPAGKADYRWARELALAARQREDGT